MSRRDLRPERGDLVPIPPPSKCAKFLYYTWKLCSVVFSHFVMISLVVAYCILGAVTFEKLESQHEKDVKMNISKIRDNTTESIWSMTVQSSCLVPANWTADVIEMLKEFESALLLEMKVRGWDGNESTEHIQWTFTGALFYSIIVITTIGYGHIAPKTQSGKVVTIFYAILGIPLMLLCLSNIGDVMASSFRFLYWRVCCYVCTRPPKRRHRHHHPSRRSVRAAIAGPSGGRGSMRRRKPIERAHSDTDFWYRDSGYSSGRARRGRPAPRTRSQPPGHSRDFGPRDYIDERLPVRGDPYGPEYYDDEPEEFPKVTLPLQDLEAAIKDLEDHHKKLSKQDIRSKSLPRPAKSKPDYGPRRDFDNHGLYDVNDPEDLEMHDLHDVDYENFREKKARELEEGRGDRDDYYGYKDRNYDPDDEDYDFEPKSRKFYSDRDRRYRGRSEYYERDRDDYPDRSRGRRARSAVYERRWEDERDEPRRDVESGRPRRLRRLQTIDDRTPSPEKDDYSDDGIRRSRVPVPATWGSRQSEIYVVEAVPTKEELKPVPIWLCVCLVSSYIVAGTFLFKRWEGWEYLDAAYFCFITLTTIGFGDFVPAQNHNQAGNAADAVHSIALCSLYLLFGIALLAMSFNLVQEQVRASVASLATKLGIIKDKDNDQY